MPYALHPAVRAALASGGFRPRWKASRAGAFPHGRVCEWDTVI